MSTSESGPVWYARQATAPVPASSAVSHPRTPISPPELPTSTFPFTTSGAIVIVSPMLMSPTLVFHTSFPVAASTATTLASSVLKTILPSANDGPRLTTSQHATPCASDCGFGSYCHFFGAPGSVRSSAYRMFGYGVNTYIVLFATIGGSSCPRSTLVEKV